jgi:hypothetical protein
MSLRGCANVIDDLVQFYPEDVVVKQLEQLYRTEIRGVIGELGELLPHYRSWVDEQTYELEQAKVRLVEAYEREGTMSVRALETSLKYLLKKRRAFAEIAGRHNCT